MPVQVRGASDAILNAVMEALREYEADHPRAEIEGFRQNSVAIRVRIIDPDFRGVSRAERHEAIWRVLEDLPEEVQSQLSTILLLAPNETAGSFANFEFDAPIPSTL